LKDLCSFHIDSDEYVKNVRVVPAIARYRLKVILIVVSLYCNIVFVTGIKIWARHPFKCTAYTYP